jgi:hypothetical protein
MEGVDAVANYAEYIKENVENLENTKIMLLRKSTKNSITQKQKLKT